METESAEMSFEELNDHYQRLRAELDAAYAASVWDSRTLDRITEELAPVELALAHSKAKSPSPSETARSANSRGTA